MGTAIILAILAIVIFIGIRSTVKRAAGGCCGVGCEKIRRIRPSDPDRSHYLYEIELTVDGMMCEGCVKSVKDSLEKTDKVRSVDVNLKKGTASVEHDGATDEALIKAVVDAGFRASVKHGLFS